VSGDQNAARGEVKASVPLVVRGVPEEHTTSRAGRQLVRSGGGGVRVTRTPEDPKVVVARRGTEESVVWSGSRRSSGRETVKQVGGGVEALSPEARGQRGLDQEGAHDVVRRANHPLSLAVLRRGIRTRHTQLNTPRQEEGPGGGVIELPPVVTLDGLNCEAELSGHPGKEVEEGGEGLRLGAQRKSPRVMRKIINNDQIIFITRHAEYRRCPQVTVNQIKSMRSMRRRRRKRKSNMTT
jgi:hypothetical protein